MTTFLLIRHAAHDLLGKRLAGRSRGVHISEAGRTQADRLATSLAEREVQALYSSPMERCQETAIPLAAALGLSPNIAAAFDEVDFGEWTGMEFEALGRHPGWREWNTCRAISRCPSGESMQEAQLRIVTGLARLADSHPAGTVAIVSHCDMIKAALMYYLGLSLNQILTFEVSAASVSTVQLAEWGSLVLTINESATI